MKTNGSALTNLVVYGGLFLFVVCGVISVLPNPTTQKPPVAITTTVSEQELGKLQVGDLVRLRGGDYWKCLHEQDSHGEITFQISADDRARTFVLVKRLPRELTALATGIIKRDSYGWSSLVAVFPTTQP